MYTRVQYVCINSVVLLYVSLQQRARLSVNSVHGESIAGQQWLLFAALTYIGWAKLNRARLHFCL